MPTPANANASYKSEVQKISSSIPRGRKIVLIGDSWINQEQQDAFSSSGRGIFMNTNALLGSVFDIISIAGGSGETLAQIEARFDTDVIALDPDNVFILGGVNSVVADVTAVSMFASMKSMIDKSLAAGIKAFVMPCQMVEGAWGATAQQQTDRVREASLYNRMVLEYSFTNGRFVFFANAWASLTDQDYIDGTTGVYLPRAKAEYITDSVHINMAGAFRVALDISPVAKDVELIKSSLPTHDAEVSSAAWNPYMKATGTPYPTLPAGTGMTGTAAQGWYNRLQNGTATSAVVSQVARTDIDGGFWNEVIVTELNGGGGLGKLQLIESDPIAFTYNYHLFSDYGIVAGDSIVFTVELKIKNVSGVDAPAGNPVPGDFNSMNGIIRIADSGNAVVTTLILNNNGGSSESPYKDSDLNDEILVYQSTKHVVQANEVKWFSSSEISTQNGGVAYTNFTVSLGRFGIKKL